jgi:hypothetical protein
VTGEFELKGSTQVSPLVLELMRERDRLLAQVQNLRACLRDANGYSEWQINEIVNRGR